MKSLIVRSGDKRLTFPLQDVNGRQVLPVDFGGPVQEVTLEVASVYDTTKWKGRGHHRGAVLRPTVSLTPSSMGWQRRRWAARPSRR